MRHFWRFSNNVQGEQHFPCSCFIRMTLPFMTTQLMIALLEMREAYLLEDKSLFIILLDLMIDNKVPTFRQFFFKRKIFTKYNFYWAQCQTKNHFLCTMVYGFPLHFCTPVTAAKPYQGPVHSSIFNQISRHQLNVLEGKIQFYKIKVLI